jgi:hypothetical protein
MHPHAHTHTHMHACMHAGVQDDPCARCTVPFLACGDLSGWDADRSYALDQATGRPRVTSSGTSSTAAAAAAAGRGSDARDGAGQQAAAGAPGGYVVLEPVQPPVHAAYRTALEQRRRGQHPQGSSGS